MLKTLLKRYDDTHFLNQLICILVKKSTKMNYSLGPRVDPRIRLVLATISRVDPRVGLKVGPSQIRVNPKVEESQLWQFSKA